MQFTNPTFLFALFFLLIPIVIHFFNFRKFKKIEFSQVKFLQQVKQQSTSQNKIKHILILISRLLALGFLILAFAQPFRQKDGRIQSKDKIKTYIYIDHSFSMQAENTNGSLIDQAKEIALKIAKEYASSEVCFISNTFFCQDEYQAIQDYVQTISCNASHFDFQKLRAKVKAHHLDQSATAQVFVLSDFQTSDYSSIQSDSNMLWNFIRLSAENPSNVYIDTCFISQSFYSDYNAEQLNFTLINDCSEPLENIELSVKINQKKRALMNLSIQSHAQLDTSIELTTDQSAQQFIELSIEDAPLSFDDHYYLALSQQTHSKVACIYQNSERHIKEVFASDLQVKFISMPYNQINYDSLVDQDFIILKNLTELSTGLQKFILRHVELHKKLLVIPAMNSNVKTYNDLYASMGVSSITKKEETESMQIEKVHARSSFFYGMFDLMPKLSKYARVDQYFKYSNQTNLEPLLSLQNKDVFLARHIDLDKQVYLMSSDLANKNNTFHNSNLFVAALYRMLYLNAKEKVYDFSINDQSGYPLNFANTFTISNLKLKNLEGTFDMVAQTYQTLNEHGLHMSDQIQLDAGHYILENSNEEQLPLSFNYSRKESVQEFLDSDQLNRLADQFNIRIIDANQITSENQSLQEVGQTISYWWICILLALLFLIFETLIIKFW